MPELGYADFYRAHWLSTVRYILYRYPQLGWQDAEDVAQDALLRVWEQWESYDPSRATRLTWLITIALWHGRTVFNRYRRASHDDAPDDDAVEPDPYERVARRELLDKAVHRIEALENGDTMKQVYERLILGDTGAQAAEAVELSYNQLIGRLQHIRAMLRQDVDANPLVL
jgi:RNA polymerase sigma-70 factor (ECF subfamily)